MPEITVELAISADEYLAHYQGSAREVIATAQDGRRIRFPSRLLQPFISHQGIYGKFVIVYSSAADGNAGGGKFQRIYKKP